MLEFRNKIEDWSELMALFGKVTGTCEGQKPNGSRGEGQLSCS